MDSTSSGPSGRVSRPYQMDAAVLSALPNVAEVLEMTRLGESPWAKAMRVKVRHTDDSEERYFMKVSTGNHGRDALKGEFESTSAIHAITPDFCPKPVAWGTFRSNPDSHFYICKFHDFSKGLPEPISFCEKLARLHARHKAPEGKCGFHCTTYIGNLPQDNTWSDTWEAFFAQGLQHVLKVREGRAGPDHELNGLLPPLFEKVIPRLLRPMETGGRQVNASLLHGDLWAGNSGIVDKRNGEGVVFDTASFWGHNECTYSLTHGASEPIPANQRLDELGNWRPERNRLTRRFHRAYHSHVPESEPKEDYDDRNALYSVKFNLHSAVLYPDQGAYLRL